MTSTRSSGTACRVLLSGALFVAALAGCATSDAETASTSGRPLPAVAAEPAAPRPTPSSDGSGSGAAGGGGGGTAGASGADGADGSGAAAASGAPGSDAGAGASSTGSASPGSAESPDAEGDAEITLPDPPTVAPSPVFLGEACLPEEDSEPAVAVNGLILHCVPVSDPTVAGAEPGAVGRWAPETPQQPTQAGPSPGAECDPADVGKVVPGSDGRPLSCLRESDGGMRWADVS